MLRGQGPKEVLTEFEPNLKLTIFLYLLANCGDGGLNGYKLGKLCAELTNVKLSYGTIYPLLKLLHEKGLVTVLETIKNGKHEKRWSISKEGTDTLERQLAFLELFSNKHPVGRLDKQL